MEDDALPQLLDVETEVFGLDMHPSQDILALGLVDGRALLYSYEGLGEKCKLHVDLGSHQEACRSVVFDPTGDLVFTASTDMSIRGLKVDGGKQSWHIPPGVHREAINCLHYCTDINLLASGDDAGVIKLWDIRQTSPVASITKHEDFISDFLAHDNLLFSASGDNTLITYDLRQRKLIMRSMDQEDELLSLLVLKRGKKLIAGTQSGVLLIYTWNEWANCSDRFVGHPETVETMVKVDEETILTGSSDGLIRLCTIMPNKLLGVLGTHDDFPVESMKGSWGGAHDDFLRRVDFSHDRRVLASIAHDSVVRLWDMSVLEDDEEDGEEEELAVVRSKKEEDGEEEESEEEEEEEDSDDEEEEDSEEDEEEEESEEEEKETNPKAAGAVKGAGKACTSQNDSKEKGEKGRGGGGGRNTKKKGKVDNDSSEEEENSSDAEEEEEKGNRGKRQRLTPAEAFFQDL